MQSKPVFIHSYFIQPLGMPKEEHASAQPQPLSSKKEPSTIIANDTDKKRSQAKQSTSLNTQKPPIDKKIDQGCSEGIKKEVAERSRKEKKTAPPSAKKRSSGVEKKAAINESRIDTKNSSKKIESKKSPSVNSEQASHEKNTPSNYGPLPMASDNETYDTPQIQNFIRGEIVKTWEPPIGMPEDLACDIIVKIGCDGLVMDSKIERSSGVLIFDLSARSAAAALVLPRWAWGREFTINFCQG